MLSRSTFTLLRRRPDWRRLWASEALSLVGDWFSLVAVSVVSLRAGGGGVVALAISLAAHLLPQALFAPVAGLLADRLDRKRILIAASLVEGALTLGMVASVSRQSIVLLQILVFLRAAVSSLRPPASGAALPRLVQPEELAPANALTSATWSVAFAAGMALGGLATELSPLIALIIDAGTFFVSAAMLTRLPRLPAREKDEARPVAGVLGTALTELRGALSLGVSPELRAHVFGKTPVALAAGAGWIALNLVAQKNAWFGGGAATLGVLQGLRGIGTGIGPIVALTLVGRGVRRAWVEHGAVASVLLGIALLTGAVSPLFSSLGVLLWGSGAGANWVLTTTRIQERAPGAFLGRLLALDALSFTVAMASSALLSSFLIQSEVALPTTALLFALLGAVAWLGLHALGRRAMRLGLQR